MREEIIKMAREAGFNEIQTNAMVFGAILERFYDMAQAAEREECAKVAQSFDPHMRWSNYGRVIANKIRERGQ